MSRQSYMDDFLTGTDTRRSNVPDGCTQVISLFDEHHTGLLPWLARGFECHAYRHKPGEAGWTARVDADGVHVHEGDLVAHFADVTLQNHIEERHAGRTAFAMAAPPSKDLAYAGRRWWPRKKRDNPRFQLEALATIDGVCRLFAQLGCPWVISMPYHSLACVEFCKPNHVVHPCEFGGYCGDENHPQFPGIVPRRDAYRQKTGLWTSAGFKLPTPRGVEPVHVWTKRKKKRVRISPMQLWRARYARKAMPRGFAKAVCERLLGPAT